MGTDIVYNYTGREIFVGETVDVTKWLISNNIPLDYKVLVQGFRNPIAVHRYLTLERPSQYKSFEGVTKMSNDPQFVPKFYVNDPETEDLIPHNSHLENGMTVILSGPGMKEDLAHMEDDPAKRYNAMKENRWATITHLKIENNGVISFVGVYKDGSKISREYSADRSWYVKKSTMPGPNDEELANRLSTI
jgi:hypothetical protein